MQDNDFLSANLVQTFRAFKKHYAGELFRLNLKLVLGYASYALPVVAIIVFFYLHRDVSSIPASSQYVFFPILFVLSFIPGMFYFVFKDGLLKRKRSVFDIYYEYGEGASETVLSGRPFVLYIRGFRQERDLGNRSSSHPLDRKFNVPSYMEEEMDRRTNFSFFPEGLAALLNSNGYPVVALGHPRLKRGLASVQLLFCRDEVWEEVIEELARKAGLIILNTLERHGDYWLKPGPGVEMEMGLILSDSALGNKTFVIHNEFENPPAPDSRLAQVIKAARWAAPFTLHDPGSQRYRPPVGEIPGELKEQIEAHRLTNKQN